MNEIIQELGHLVPTHRIEDDKVGQGLQANSPLSPPLAGLARRRRAASKSPSIQVGDKDKSPNKGDILNGTVGWIHDLMWMLHSKLQHQEELAKIITNLGGSFPFEETEDEKRIRVELMDVVLMFDRESLRYLQASGRHA